jgi:phosphomannomutase/phosphoglucomutase
MEKISQKLKYNSAEYEREPLVDRYGFREYDARWRFPESLNLAGMRCVGAGLGTQLRRMGGGATPKVVVGHDYRWYSSSVKHALAVGLMSAGCEVYDIGVAITPAAYFARQHLNAPGVAMVTASHNPNGWTGVKVGDQPPLTHGPKEMAELRDIVLAGDYHQGEGRYFSCPDVAARFLDNLAEGVRLTKPLKVVVATGNGTSGLFAPQLLERIGCQVIPLHCDLDWTFPNYNPNPEDHTMLVSVREEVKRTGADIGFAFDGDGDRLGVIDDEGVELFADKMGLLIARDLSRTYPNSKFVVDVKSTGLFERDEVLASRGCTVDYWITGHSYIKRRVHELGALAGFEKSGHYFPAPPIGGGYDDAMRSALLVAQLLDHTGKKLSELRRELPRTWQSLTMSPSCPDDKKYGVVQKLRETYEQLHASGATICGRKIARLITVNGIRVVLDDGTWGLVRASSNQPVLVVVVESPTSAEMMKSMFYEVDARLRQSGEVGPYDQGIEQLESHDA